MNFRISSFPATGLGFKLFQVVPSSPVHRALQALLLVTVKLFSDGIVLMIASLVLFVITAQTAYRVLELFSVMVSPGWWVTLFESLSSDQPRKKPSFLVGRSLGMVTGHSVEPDSG